MSEDLNKKIAELERTVRSKRNAAQAGIMLSIIIAALTTAWLYMHHTTIGAEAAANEVVVSSDSLRNLTYTLEEQAEEIEAQQARIEALESEIELADQDSISSNTEVENADEEEYLEESEFGEEEVNLVPEQEESKSTPSDDIHVVAEGESLWGIAVMHYGDGYKSRDLASANGLADPSQIIVGETLKLVK